MASPLACRNRKMMSRNPSPPPSSENFSSSTSLLLHRCRELRRLAARRRVPPLRIQLGSTAGRRFICPICGAQFRNNNALSGHFNFHRKDRSPSPGPKQPPKRRGRATSPHPPPPPYLPPPGPGHFEFEPQLWTPSGPSFGPAAASARQLAPLQGQLERARTPERGFVCGENIPTGWLTLGFGGGSSVSEDDDKALDVELKLGPWD
ncbi:hypothetical protein Ancab_030911 [Ancistrocladus abbreviatus]